MLVAEEPKVNVTSHYSIKETAKFLGLSKRTIERKIKSRDIKTIIKKIDSKQYITGLEILRIWNKTF